MNLWKSNITFASTTWNLITRVHFRQEKRIWKYSEHQKIDLKFLKIYECILFLSEYFDSNKLKTPKPLTWNLTNIVCTPKLILDEMCKFPRFRHDRSTKTSYSITYISTNIPKRNIIDNFYQVKSSKVFYIRFLRNFNIDCDWKKKSEQILWVFSVWL